MYNKRWFWHHSITGSKC